MTMSKRQQIREKQRRQQNMQRIGLIIGMVLVAVAVVGWVILAQRPVEGIVQVKSTPRPQANANMAGDPNAPVKITEYADFQCPFCMHFWRDTEAQLMDAYVKPGKVYFEYKSMGLFIGPESARAAEAAYCAGDQGKFWEMHDTIFGNQGAAENAGALDDAHLRTFAKNIGLDTATFDDCFNNGKYQSKIAQDKTDGVALGVTSTPSFIINGQLVSGALSFDEFKTKIDAALAAAGQ
jgi:protein-disulfide isomerase